MLRKQPTIDFVSILKKRLAVTNLSAWFAFKFKFIVLSQKAIRLGSFPLSTWDALSLTISCSEMIIISAAFTSYLTSIPNLYKSVAVSEVGQFPPRFQVTAYVLKKVLLWNSASYLSSSFSTSYRMPLGTLIGCLESIISRPSCLKLS